MTKNEKAWYIVGGAVILGGLIYIGYELHQILKAINRLADQTKARIPKSQPETIDVTPESASDLKSNQKPDISPVNAIVPQSEPILKSESDLNQNPDLNSESAPLFQLTKDFRTVKVKQSEYKVSPTQGRVINRMWEYLNKGIHQVHQDTLLEDLGVYSNKMKDVFKNSPLWKSLVRPAGKGFYRLDLP